MLKILIAVDGSEHSERTVRQVAALAPKVSDLHARLVIVEAAPLNWEYHHGVAEDEAVLRARALGQRKLKKERQLLEAAGIPHEWSVELGDPAEEIVRTSNETGCDMIVLGSHGLGTVAGLLLGSVAAKVIHASHVPVLLMK